MKLTHYENPQLRKLRGSGSLFGSSVFDDLFNDFWSYVPRQPRAELSEDDAAYYVRIELPGAKKDSIHLELTDAKLTVSSRTVKEADEPFSSEGWSRIITLPDGLQLEEVSAKHEDGVLKVTLPKAESRKPRKIEVQ
ncbi:MAG: Hsp20/alpha crystallin family protein [Coraliomargaritaceae bacterium]